MRLAVLALLPVFFIGACHKQAEEAGDVLSKIIPKAVSNQSKGNASAVENQYGTPVKDRMATLGLLNKRNNLTQTFQLKSGQSLRIGNVVVKLATCEKTLPWEDPPEIGAFVQLFVLERAKPSDAPSWRKDFSGWLYKNAPSVNVVEHPVYDVWVKDCAMKFPGEEEDPEKPAAAASSAAKPVGKGEPAAAATRATTTVVERVVEEPSNAGEDAAGQ